MKKKAPPKSQPKRKAKAQRKAPAHPPADAAPDLSEARPDIDAKILQNIIDKIAGGGVPTEREQRLLERATAKRTTGRPATAIRWTIDHASNEFGPDRRTLTKRLLAASIAAGPDGRYSTRDLIQALYEFDNPRDEKDREQAANFRLKNEELRRQRIPIDIVNALWDSALQSFGAHLKAAKLPKAKTNELLAKLRAAQLPLKW